MKRSEKVPIHSVGKAMELIEILLQRRAPMSLNALAEAAGYPKPTVYALLSTMREYSVIVQQPDGKYYLGMKLYECGCAVSGRWDISAIAHPYLEQLAQLSGASAYISVIEGNDVVTFDQCVGSSGIRISSEIGSRLPLHATSQGKLLLSQFSDAEVRGRLAAIGMQAFTPHTMTDPEQILEALHKISDDGYAVEDGEYKIGLRSVSAPIYNYEGKLAYAVGVVGLFRRVHSEEFEKAVAGVLATANQLSNAIGYR